VLQEENFQKALSALSPGSSHNTGGGSRRGAGGSGRGGRIGKKGKGGGTGGPSDVYKIVKMIMERNYQPGLSLY